jgi:4-carboxymuconolactone decarboxylase
MSRVPEATRDSLSPRGQQAWDLIAGTRGGVSGPYQVLIPVPALAERVANLGTYLRFEGLLSGPDRELAILVVARAIGSRYEWVGHEAIARREGVRPDAIEVARTQSSPSVLTPRERLIVDRARTLQRDHQLNDGLFTAAQKELGPDQVVELVALIGYYTMIAYVLVAFEVEPKPGGPPPF